MTVRVPLLVLLALVLAACGDEHPWGASIPVTLDLKMGPVPNEIALLQPFDLRLDLFCRSDLEVEFSPEVPNGTVGTVEIEPDRELAHGRWRRAWLHLRATEGPGPLPIAPFRARSKDGTAAVATDEWSLQVTSVLAAAAVGESAPAAATGEDVELPGPLLLPPPAMWPYWAAAFAALLLGGAIAMWRRQSAQPQPPMTVVKEPAHQKALRELQRLRAWPRQSESEVAAFYIATSQVLRVYLEERFALRAPERTTEEFLAEVEAGGPLTLAQCLELRRFLHACDLVKFAAHVPQQEQHLVTLSIAEQFVITTRADAAVGHELATSGGAA